MASNSRGRNVDPNLKARAEGRVFTPEEIDEKLDRLETRMAQLRNRYDQFFLGLDRKAPHHERELIRRELEFFKNVNINNTSVKFRYNSVWNRYLAYERMWLRTLRDIEEGRYTKDLFKMRLHRNGRPTQEEEVDTSSFDEEPAPPSGQAKAPAAADRGPTDERLRALYAAYLAAKQECRQPTAGMSFEAMATRLRQQVPELLEQTKAKAIDFKVVIRDGKAALRAVLKPE
jgi:hypothetical protein